MDSSTVPKMSYLDCLLKTTRLQRTHVLVLGFYDRQNTGDEMYKLAFRRIFRGTNAKLDFQCMDDVKTIPTHIDVIVCGGGDVINAYFMEKLVGLVCGMAFNGPIYALSVGVPYASCANYLEMFDHVFVRSKGDFAVARSMIGERNVTCLPDACFALQHSTRHPQNSCVLRVGVCLAKPSITREFMNNLAMALRWLSMARNIEINIIPFNLSLTSLHECDYDACSQLMDMIPGSVYHSSLCTPESVVALVQDMNVAICMRYHAAVFALGALGKDRVITVASSTKLDRLSKDHGCFKLRMNMKSIDIHSVIEESIAEINSKPVTFPACTWKPMRNMVWHTAKRKSTLIKAPPKRNHKEYIAALEKVRSLGVTDPYLVCHLCAQTVNSRHLFGLIQAINCNIEFDLDKAMRYIWGDYEENRRLKELRLSTSQAYYPNLLKQGNVFIDFDEFVSLDSYHRSGWPYVIDNIMFMHAKSAMRDPVLFFDSYVDRTFHWGCSAYRALGIVPYKKRWIGIIHHTFDESQSPHNCKNLFRNPMFLESLDMCAAIICLSKHLAMKVRTALNMSGKHSVEVHVLYHPTELMDVMMWSNNLFKKNQDRKVIQIGAWLRKVDAIKDLALGNNLLKLRRTVLGASASRVSGGILFDPHADPLWSSENSTHNAKTDVDEIPLLDNDMYDRILSENVVFLNLVDCSAVNTVIECIARTTPIVVNRLPALIEVLGAGYPGFYNDLEGASCILNSLNRIDSCHMYLRKMNKNFLSIERFVNGFHQLIVSYKKQ